MQNNSFNDFLKKQLNKPQFDAVTFKKGALLVIAGAGSGKTRVITSKIAHLILNENVPTSSIIALTFTNKAANEMKERVAKIIANDAIKLPFVGTFHSFCLMLLRSNPSLISYDSFSILDGDDQLAIVKKIIKQNNLEKQLNASTVLSQISNTKNKLAFNKENLELLHPLIRDIFIAYEKEKSSSMSFDFDDLMLEVVKIFRINKTFRTKFQEMKKHILVDEYQDTNLVQHSLLSLMSLNDENKFAIDSLCAVGDEDQSIYSWRGAEPENILKFEEDFAPVTKIKIEQNYRSVEPILQLANELISNNKARNKKNLWSERIANNRILFMSSRSEYQESEIIGELIKIIKSKQSLNSIAILYRTHFQSRVIEEGLTRNGIAYKIIGGIQFYSRKEIKDLLAYLKLILNPYDKISFFRIINCPTRGIGSKFEENIEKIWSENPNLNFKEVLQLMLSNKNILDGKKAETIKNFLKIFENLDKKQKTSIAIDHILFETEYISYLKNSFDEDESQNKIENIKELRRSIEYFENQKSKKSDFIIEENSLEKFLYEIALIQEKMELAAEGEDVINLMTLHAAKGLEFDVVIIIGLEEGILPTSRALSSREDLEEERRLLYVGITRAKEFLLISHALTRNNFGTIQQQSTSRFINELPKNLFETVDFSEEYISNIKTLLSSWISGTFTKPFNNKSIKENIISYASSKIIKNEKLNPKDSDVKWQKNQIVFHKTFGRGIITNVEKRIGEDEYFITAIFSSGAKKILSKFLEKRHNP